MFSFSMKLLDLYSGGYISPLTIWSNQWAVQMAEIRADIRPDFRNLIDQLFNFYPVVDNFSDTIKTVFWRAKHANF